VDADGDQLLDVIAAERPRLVEPEPRVLEDELEGEADEAVLDLLPSPAAVLEQERDHCAQCYKLFFVGNIYFVISPKIVKSNRVIVTMFNY